jgi:hypothetical protein
MPGGVGQTALRKVLRELTLRWEAADKKAWHAMVALQDPEKRKEAECERYEVELEFWKLSLELGDLLILLVRCCMDDDDLRRHLTSRLLELLAPEIREMFRPELESLAQAISRLERRR